MCDPTVNDPAVSRRVTLTLFIAFTFALGLIAQSSYARELEPLDSDSYLRILAAGIVPGDSSLDLPLNFTTSGTALTSFDFPPLKFAIPTGTGFVPRDGGYNNALLHLNGGYDKYALDICEGSACYRFGRHAIAPTDIKYEETAPYAYGYHFFEVYNDGLTKLCMSLGHFNWPSTIYPSGAPPPGTFFPSGAVLGELHRWERLPHVHMGIWTMAAVSPYGYPTQCTTWSVPHFPQPFTGPFSIDDQEFPECWPGSYDCYGVHAGRRVESSNAPFCYDPLDDEIVGQGQDLDAAPADRYPPQNSLSLIE